MSSFALVITAFFFASFFLAFLPPLRWTAERAMILVVGGGGGRQTSRWPRTARRGLADERSAVPLACTSSGANQSAGRAAGVAGHGGCPRSAGGLVVRSRGRRCSTLRARAREGRIPPVVVGPKTPISKFQARRMPSTLWHVFFEPAPLDTSVELRALPGGGLSRVPAAGEAIPRGSAPPATIEAT